MAIKPPVTIPPDAPAQARKRRRTEQVAETIKSWMADSRLMPGDRLPPEPELIRDFGMAKGTIREALRLLEAQGLVQSRTGPKGGVFVAPVSEARARALLGNYVFFKDIGIGDIYQLRRMLEPELAASLAGRLAAADLAQLEAAMSRYEAPPETLEESAAQRIAELEFHELLAGFSPNPLLAFQCRFLIGLLKDLTVCRKIYRQRIPEFRRTGRAFQIRLLDAIRTGDDAAAREIMARHMETAQRVMEREEAKLRRSFLDE